MAWFGARAARPDAAARRRIEDWARAEGGFGPDTVVKANEIVCPDPACPGFETVILVMAPNERSRARKILKSLAAVTREDVAAALRSER